MAIRNSLIEAYGLNSPGVNLLDHAGNHDYQSFGKANDNENTQIIYDNINNYVSVTQPKDANLGIYRTLNSIIVGGIYNLSFYAYSDTDCDFLFGITSASEVFGSSLHVNAGEWTKCWCVGKASNTTIAFYTNSPSFKIRNVKFTKCSSTDCYFFQYTDINDELKPFVYNFKDLQTNCRNTEYFTDDNPINELISWENFKYLLKEFVEYEEWQYSNDKSYRTRNTTSIIDWCDGSNKSSVSNTEREDATIEYGTPELTLVVDDIPASGGTISDGTVSYGQSKYYVYSDTRFKVTDESGVITKGLIWGDSVTAQSLGTTIKDRSVVGSLSVSTTINGKTESTTADVYQQANRIESYGTPTGRTLSVSDIPASGGTISRGTLGGTITQSCTYTSGSNGTLTNPTITSTSYSTSITAESLGTTIKDRTKIGTLTYTYVCNKKTGSISADVYQQANNATDITYGDWSVSLSANKYTASSSPAPASGGTAAITSSASRTRIQNYTSGATSKLSNETVSPSLSVTGSGFSLSGSNVIVANRTTTEGSSRTGSVTATHGGVSKSITLYQTENKLVAVSATGSASTGTVLNVSPAGGTVTWSPVVEYSSGWSGTPPSGVTITYSVAGEGATQSNNTTTWANRGSIIGPWRDANVTLSAKSSYTTNPIKGIVSTGQNMNTVTAVNFIDCQGAAAHQTFSAAGAAYCYVGEWTLSSGSKTQGYQYKDYITYSFSSDFGTWTLHEKGYYGTVLASPRGYTLGAKKSGTLTYKISGTINKVSIDKTASITLTQEANIVTAVSIVNVSGDTPTSSFTAAGSSGYNYYGKATYSSGNTQLSVINAERFSYTLSGTGFSKSDATNKSYTKVIVANRATTIGNSRTGSLVVSFTNPSFTGYTNTVSSPALTLTQAGNYVASFKVFMSTFSYDNISAGATSASPKLVSQTPNIEYTFSSGSTSNATPSSTYGSYSSTVSYKLGSAINGFTAVNKDTGVLTATNRGTTIGNARTSGVVTRTLTGTWTPTASYNSGGTKTWSGSSTATCTQAANTVTALVIRGCGDVDPLKSFTATNNTPCYAEKLTFSSGATAEGNNYKDYITFKFDQTSWGTWIPDSQKYFGILNIASRGTTIGAARTGTLTCTISGTINGVSVNKSGTLSITQALNKMVSITEVKSNTTYSPTTLSAAGGNSTPSYTGNCKLTFSSGSTTTYQASGWSGMKISRSWSLSSTTGFSINTNSGVVTAASRGNTIGAARSTVANAKLTFSYTNPSTVGGGTVTGTDTDNITITQALNTVTSIDIRACGGAIEQPTTSYPASGASYCFSFSCRLSSGLDQEISIVDGLETWSFNQSWGTWATTSENRWWGMLTIPSRGTTIDVARSGTLTCTLKGTINGVSINTSDSVTITQALNKVVAVALIPSSGNSDTTNYPSGNFTAAGGTKAPTLNCIQRLTLSSGSSYDTTGTGSFLGGTSSISRTWSMATATGFSMNKYGVVTAASRGTTVGAARTCNPKCVISGSFTNPSSVGSTVVNATSVTDSFTLTQEANEKSNEYSNLVGHIQSTSWNKNTYYTNFWATGDYTEKYTSGATGESGNGSVPWDSVTTSETWCRWNDVQGAVVYDGNTGLQRKATITGRIGSWTYSVEVTQAAGLDVGKLTLVVPVSIGFAEYWNITVRSTANAIIYSGGIDTGLSTGSKLVMTKECAAAVALDHGTVSFSTTYSTGTDRRYSGSISGTEQDQLKQGKDVTVYLS